MNLPKGYVLKEGQLANPVVWRAEVSPAARAAFPVVPSSFWQAVHGDSKKSFKWWDRAADEKTRLAPHWLAVRGGTPLHTDPKYMRYTHQLVVHNDGWTLHGFDNVQTPVTQGTMFCCDTYSPHKVTRVVKGARDYLAISIDADRIVPVAELQDLFLEYLARGVLPPSKQD